MEVLLECQAWNKPEINSLRYQDNSAVMTFSSMKTIFIDQYIIDYLLKKNVSFCIFIVDGNCKREKRKQYKTVLHSLRD